MKYKNAIKLGVLSGIAIIFTYLAAYFVNKNIVTQPYFPYLIYLVHVPFMIAAGLQFRARHADLIDFRIALREVMITFLVGMIFYFIIYYVLFNYDLSLVAEQKRVFVEHYTSLKEYGGIKGEDFRKMKEAWEQDDFKVTIPKILQGLPFRILGGFVLGLLVSLMVKR